MASESGDENERRVDALIVTALQDEMDAVLTLGSEGRVGWRDHWDGRGLRYYRRTLQGSRGEIEVAASWIGETGETAAAIRGQQLIAELDPGCLAMCGICSGDPACTTLGDVIVADRLYRYDDGRRVAEPGERTVMFHDIRTFDLHALWRIDAAYLAREIDLQALRSARPPTKPAQMSWLLGAIHAHETEGGLPPTTPEDPERKPMCPDWTGLLREAVKTGLVVLGSRNLALTQTGRAQVLDEKLFYPDGPPEPPPMRVHVGAIGTGSAMQQDPRLFNRLRRLVRTTLGAETEGAAVGALGAWSERPAIVVKAVSDHADSEDDYRFRLFACRASAEVLGAFLQKHIEPRARRREPPEYKLGGDIAGSFWHVIGLCRFEPGELDPYLPPNRRLRLPDDADFRTLPPLEPLEPGEPQT